MRTVVLRNGPGNILGIFMTTAALAAVGCGGHSRSAPDAAAFDRLGVSCGEVRAVASSEVVIDDAAPECEGGFCVHSAAVAPGGGESAGLCSCRCDGPAGTGPFCTCDEGFVCREQVSALGMTPPVIAGSYCLPAP
jgi:hypothetical protein